MKRSISIVISLWAFVLAGCGEQRAASAPQPKADEEVRQTAGQAKLPDVPPPDPNEAEVPAGYEVSVAMQDLTYPTSVEFDTAGNLYVAEAGYSYGDDRVVPRILRMTPQGQTTAIPTQGALNGPINDLLWYDGKLFISHRGKISVLEGDTIRDLVTDLPSDGDHHNNQLCVGPDGLIYFGQGTASNSGVVGYDNYKMGWLAKHPEFHDIPAQDIRLVGQEFASKNPLKAEQQFAQTAAFHAFNTTSPTGTVVKGQTKASGTILRMRPDGSQLEVYAWGLRNPFGLAWTPDGKLLASENGFDDRGSRPVANDKEDLYEIKQGAWYGWPDFASGLPVTNAMFKPKDHDVAQFVMLEHPPVEQPLLTFPPHAAATKLLCVTNDTFALAGSVFLSFFGHMSPMTGHVEEHGGHRVVLIDLANRKSTNFFAKKEHGGHGGHSGSHEHESVTAGPRRLLDVVLSPKGDALYVVDFGSMIVEKDKTHPIPRTGVVWKITRKPGE